MTKTVLTDRRAALKGIPLFITLFLSLVGATCQSSYTTTSGNKNANATVPIYGYETVKVYSHDPEAFTQGLIFRDGNLIESTGEVGHSSLRRVELETGTVVQKVDVPRPFFAEGITLLKGKIYQLTWQHQLGFVYDALSFEKLGEFNYQGEGWGLANDGQSLILSDAATKFVS